MAATPAKIRKEMDSSSTPGPSVSSNSNVQVYSKLVVPVSMRSIYWQYFGFPANDNGDIVSRARIVCILCKTQIAYNKNTSNLRMHLQNKHLNDLINLESNATPRTCKSKLLRRSSPSQEEEYYVAGSPGDVIAISDMADAILVTEDGKKYIREDGGDEGMNLVTSITNYAVLDLEMPDVVDGRGFQRLMVNIESPCRVPSKEMLTGENIPKLYEQVRTKLLEEITALTCEVGLTIEEWTCSNNRQHLSICIYYQVQNQNKIDCKMLTTITFLPTMDTQQWETILTAIFNEWNITSDKVTAVICSSEREAILNAFSNRGYFLLPCLDFTIRECVQQCFVNDVIKNIINKIRDQIIFLRSNPFTLDALNQQSAFSEMESEKLLLDVEPIWLSTLGMLESAIQWREVTRKLLNLEVGEPLHESLTIGDDEWDVITDLVNVLQPLKMTLLSLSEEKVPFISLIRPMMWQLINNKLTFEESDSETMHNLKKAIVDMLKYRYYDERIAAMLDISTIVDPRFKLMPHLDENEKAVASNTIVDLMQKVAVDDYEDDCEDPNRKVTNMQLLLGFRHKKVKRDVEETAKVELTQFLNYPTTALNSCPISWWWRQRDKYLRLSLIADKYLCVPAVSTLPGKRTLDAMMTFHTRRSVLPYDLIEQYLFLHVNHDVP